MVKPRFHCRLSYSGSGRSDLYYYGCSIIQKVMNKELCHKVKEEKIQYNFKHGMHKHKRRIIMDFISTLPDLYLQPQYFHRKK